MVETKVAKITISLPKDLLGVADRLAKHQATTRSGLIARLLEEAERERIEVLMEEGYKEMAEENRKFAEEVFPIASETILKYTRWDEPDNG